MLYASVNGKKIQAQPGLQATCPLCEGEMIPKCGDIVIWHWAHKSVVDCDQWAEESEWHLEWKGRVDPNHCEVVIQKGGKVHRADIVVAGLVVELQASSISPAEIREREQFYGNMVWLFQADDWSERLEQIDDLDFTAFGDMRGVYWWKHGHKSLLACKKPMFWDIDDAIVKVRVWSEEVYVESYNPITEEWYPNPEPVERVFVAFLQQTSRYKFGKFLGRRAGQGQ